MVRSFDLFAWFCYSSIKHHCTAGSHDVKLLEETLAKLNATSPGNKVMVPRYDKSLRAGRGDRLPISSWTVATGMCSSSRALLRIVITGISCRRRCSFIRRMDARIQTVYHGTYSIQRANTGV
jgi:hypothetical protein